MVKLPPFPSSEPIRSDMDPTARADEIAAEMRAFYEANKDPLWRRLLGMELWRYGADDVMLGLRNLVLFHDPPK